MIRVVRSQPAPGILSAKGKKKAAAHCKQFTRNAVKYRTGQKRFKFDAGIYGHTEVKRRLVAMQHDKCAFCESKVTHIAYGDVEHFRPKGECQQDENAAAQTPGYYWLAYTWENLLFACQRCNQERKKNLFPLADETKRARDHRQSIAGEKPLLIDPVNEDPQQLIGFDPVGVPYPIRNNRRAKATITVLGLDRPKLNERRHGHLQMLESLHALATKLRGSKAMPSTDPDLIRIEILLRQAVEDEAEYTALARATLP